MTKQPEWELIVRLEDYKNPIEEDGIFIYKDKTGVYSEEAEFLFKNDDNTWTVFRVLLEKCRKVEIDDNHIYLVLDQYNSSWPYPVNEYDEWFHSDLAKVAETSGYEIDSLRDMFCDNDPVKRVFAYKAIGDYYGYINLDNYPLEFKNREEVEERYQENI